MDGIITHEERCALNELNFTVLKQIRETFISENTGLEEPRLYFKILVTYKCFSILLIQLLIEG